jgi:hypothetical protein
MRRPIGQAFLLNNCKLTHALIDCRNSTDNYAVSHIRNTTSSFNSDIIGPGAEDMLNKAFRSAKK